MGVSFPEPIFIAIHSHGHGWLMCFEAVGGRKDALLAMNSSGRPVPQRARQSRNLLV